MSIEPIIFYFFSAILLGSALMVITMRNAVHSVLSLVLVFFTSAAIWIMLEAEFLAIVLVLVYVGAVMVLFLFVVMMLSVNDTVRKEGFIKYLPAAAVVAIIVFIEIALVVGPEHFGLDSVPAPVRHGADYNNTAELGNLLYTVYVYPFELAAVLLLVAIVAAISLTMRRRPDTKHQKPEEQVLVTKQDRLRIIKMESVNKTKTGDKESGS